MVRVRTILLLVAAPLMAHAQQNCSLNGTVVNSITGQPIPGARIVASAGMKALSSIAEKDGRWSFFGLVCQFYRIQAESQGFVDSFRDHPAFQYEFDLKPNISIPPARITLTPEVAFTGNVQDVNGTPVGVTQVGIVNVVIGGGMHGMVLAERVTTDLQGNFRASGLVAGRYVVCADSNDLVQSLDDNPSSRYGSICYPAPLTESASKAISLEAGHELRVSLTLPIVHGVAVSGTLTSEEDLSRATVWLEGPTDLPVVHVRPNGKFELRAVPPGIYTVRASMPLMPKRFGGYATSSAQIEVKDADVEGVALPLRPPPSLTGTINVSFSGAKRLSETDVVRKTLIMLKLYPVIEKPYPAGLDFSADASNEKWDTGHRNFEFHEVRQGKYYFSAYTSPETYVKSMTLAGVDILNRSFAIDGPTGPIDIVLSDDVGALEVQMDGGPGKPDRGIIILQPEAGKPESHGIYSAGHGKVERLPVGNYKIWAYDDLTDIAWAENNWLATKGGPPAMVTIRRGQATNVTITRIHAEP